MMFGRGPEPAAATVDVVRFMQWNVWWGGGPYHRNEQTWNVMIEEARSQWPDIIVLNEAPGKERIALMAAGLGDDWDWVNRRQEEEGGADRIGVLSRWPVDKEKTLDFRNGGGMVVRVDHPDGPIRILGVDGLSHPLLSRTPMLDDVAAVCREYENRGLRIDVICGDFNAMSRSIGFDVFRTMSGGYRLASDHSSEWRATYRAGFPLYDIDHVWVHQARAGLACELFTNMASNHRGQLATFSATAR
jgi:endonuclease/exonuclease/phosphatase family metal-dependent hydrolase